MANEPSPQEIKKAVSGMRDADKRSDAAYNNALKDNAQTNQKLAEIAKDNDNLMARIHQIGNRLADPHERNQKISDRKQARLQARIQRQYEKTQQLIQFWSKKYVQHIETNNIYDESTRKEDETLNKIELKLVKYGVDTDELFQNRTESRTQYIDPNKINQETLKQIANNKDIDSEPDDEEQLKNLENMEYVQVTYNPEHVQTQSEDENESKQAQKNRNKTPLIKIDDKDINFKPSAHRYPGLSDVKPLSAFTSYKPITEHIKHNENTQDIETQEEETQNDDNDIIMEQAQNARYKNLEHKVPQNNLYPPMGGLKLKTNFKKYTPIINPKHVQNNKVNDTRMAINDDDLLLDALDDVDGFQLIVKNDNKSDKAPQHNAIQAAEEDDDDLLDELDDVEIPLNMYTNNSVQQVQNKTQINPIHKQNKNTNNVQQQRMPTKPLAPNNIQQMYPNKQQQMRTNPLQKQQQMHTQQRYPQNKVPSYNTQQMRSVPKHMNTQRAQPFTGNVAMQIQPQMQQTQAYGAQVRHPIANNMNPQQPYSQNQQFAPNNMQQYGVQQMYQRPNYNNPQKNQIRSGAQLPVNTQLNNNGPNIKRAKSMNSVNVQNNKNQKKYGGYPKIVKKDSSGRYPNIYNRKKPNYNKTQVQVNSDNNEDTDSEDLEIDQREFSV